VSGQTFKTQTAAREFLESRGYKVGKSAFNNHVTRDRLVGTNAEGFFEEQALLNYAEAHLESKVKAASSRIIEAKSGEASANEQLRVKQAEWMELKLARERGELIPRADHERELSTRAQFFRADLLALPREVIPQLVVALGGDESKIAAARKLLEEALLTRMDFWSSDREFVVPLDQESLPDA